MDERKRLDWTEQYDCSEKGQAYGKRAKQATSEFVFGKEVAVNTTGKDRYGRTLVSVILPDGRNLNRTLVRDGWCWWHRKYAPGNATLERLETEAREAGRGLFKEMGPGMSIDSPSPECPARKSGDEWRGEPSEALAKAGYGQRRVPHSY
jgi:endonuclease YncB( thermonuclease family)